MKKGFGKAHNPPRKCTFCRGGGPGNPITGEHVWSEWMHQYLKSDPSSYRVEMSGRLIRATRNSIATRRKETKKKGEKVISLKVRTVCKKCNSGWMSRIETEVASHLVPLITRVPHRLRKDSADIILNWIFMKSIAIDSLHENQAFPAKVRDDYFENRSIPKDELRVWLVPIEGPNWSTRYERAAADLSFPEPYNVPRDMHSNVMTITFGIGGLGIFLVYNRTYLPLVPTNIPGLVELHPHFRALDWPSGVLLSDSIMDGLVALLPTRIHAHPVSLDIRRKTKVLEVVSAQPNATRTRWKTRPNHFRRQ